MVCSNSGERNQLIDATNFFVGVKVFVDVRSQHVNYSNAVSDELRKLGAAVHDKLLPSVTHVVFKDGSKATETKAHKYGCHLVSVNWVDR